MIRPLAALTRQVQEFFHTNLVGLYRWEQVEFMPAERITLAPPETWDRTSRGKRTRPERPEGKYHQSLRLQFGLWDLEVESPNEKPPLGWVRLGGWDTMEGPLDPETWKKIAERIKQKHMEMEDGAAVSSS